MSQPSVVGDRGPFLREWPRYLFRYAPAGDGLNYLEDWALRGQLWLSSRNDFNDPFDCLPVVTLPSGELARRNLLTRSRENVRGKGFSPEMEADADAVLRTIRKWPKRKVEAYLAEQFSDVTSRIGIRCFAENHADVLMWSHYAHYHSGVCLRLKMSLWPRDAEQLLGQVEYADERARVGAPGTEEFRLGMVHALIRKASGWAYEREWRLLVHDRAHSLFQLPTDLVDAVYIGAKAPEDTVARVRGWREARPDLRIFRMTLCERTYNLKEAELR